MGNGMKRGGCGRMWAVGLYFKMWYPSFLSSSVFVLVAGARGIPQMALGYYAKQSWSMSTWSRICRCHETRTYGSRRFSWCTSPIQASGPDGPTLPSCFFLAHQQKNRFGTPKKKRMEWKEIPCFLFLKGFLFVCVVPSSPGYCPSPMPTFWARRLQGVSTCFWVEKGSKLFGWSTVSNILFLLHGRPIVQELAITGRTTSANDNTTVEQSELCLYHCQWCNQDKATFVSLYQMKRQAASLVRLPWPTFQLWRHERISGSCPLGLLCTSWDLSNEEKVECMKSYDLTPILCILPYLHLF